jgi:hypothetical protein
MIARVDGVIPFRVEGVAGEVDGGEFCVGDLDAFGVDALVEAGVDGEAGAGGPRACSSAARFRRLFAVQRSGRSGSPRLSPSTSRSRSPSNVGSFSVRRLRPAPDRRTRPGPGETPEASSARPRLIVEGAIPVARATAAVPPRPNELASAAAHNRNPRSSSSPTSSRNRSPIAASSAIHLHSAEAADPSPLTQLFLRSPLAPLRNDSRCSGRTVAANSHGLRSLSVLATPYAMRGRNGAPQGCCRAPSRWCPGVDEALPRKQNPCSGLTVNHAMGM